MQINMNNDLSKEEINGFYKWIRTYWGEISSDKSGNLSNVLNFGVWNEDCTLLYDAQENFLNIIIAYLGNINSKSKGIEIGCGIGGFAIKLVSQTNVQLHCLDLLAEHLQLSKEYAEKKKVEQKITFIQGSSSNLSTLADESFDFAYCIESSFHYTDKEQFFDEVYRVLKPGGTFVIADITCENNNKITFKQGNHFPSSEDFSSYLDKACFVKKSHKSVGVQVFKPLLKYVKTYNKEHNKRDKLTKYWERVLTNYSDLFQEKIMDYEIYKLQKRG